MRAVRPPGSPTAGFTLLEMSLAAFVLAIGILGLFALQIAATADVERSRSRGDATFLAHSLMDRIVAEGAIASAERYQSANGTITSTGWAFIAPAATTAHTASAAEDLYYDISGNLTAKGAANVFFTVSWQRGAVVQGSNVLAMQPFVVNVAWLGTVRVGGTVQTRTQYFSVSRNVSV